jgi:hypothetical protein
MGNQLFTHLKSLAASMQPGETVDVPGLHIHLREPNPDFTMHKELQAHCAKLVERTKEALLEARDETDVRWMRDAAIRNLNHLFNTVNLYTSEFALLKLECLEDLEHECRMGHFQACQRSRKWRKAVVDRYFGESAA